MIPDHPRSRGEYQPHSRRKSGSLGSSPLSRGILKRIDDSALVRGIIPALAGNTSGLKFSGGLPVNIRNGIIPALAGNTIHRVFSSNAGKDHPRSRGEYPDSRIMVLIYLGSSPLSRGIHRGEHKTYTVGRIIPALAGNTRPHNLLPLRYRGSSPLSRGIRRPSGHGLSLAGIIPALAGNTGTGEETHIHPTDHPRSRGEYDPQLLCTAPRLGSSPLSRGIHPNQNRPTTMTRIIPALAGNTDGQPTTELQPGGSSPLSRGIPARCIRSTRRRRIIPALAGNTAWFVSKGLRLRDHPRSRGEYP